MSFDVNVANARHDEALASLQQVWSKHLRDHRPDNLAVIVRAEYNLGIERGADEDDSDGVNSWTYVSGIGSKRCQRISTASRGYNAGSSEIGILIEQGLEEH